MNAAHKGNHAENYALMMENFKISGKYVDPVSGREFPPGQQMLEHPNRSQMRCLERWRKSGKVKPWLVGKSGVNRKKVLDTKIPVV